MLVHSLAWRKLHNLDRLLETYRSPEIMEKYYPGGWHFFDRGKYNDEMTQDYITAVLINNKTLFLESISWWLMLLSFHFITERERESTIDF